MPGKKDDNTGHVPGAATETPNTYEHLQTSYERLRMDNPEYTRTVSEAGSAGTYLEPVDYLQLEDDHGLPSSRTTNVKAVDPNSHRNTPLPPVTGSESHSSAGATVPLPTARKTKKQKRPFERNKKLKIIVIVLAVLIVIAVVAVLVYFFTGQSNTNENQKPPPMDGQQAPMNGGSGGNNNNNNNG